MVPASSLAVNKLWMLPIKVPAINDVDKCTDNPRKINDPTIMRSYPLYARQRTRPKTASSGGMTLAEGLQEARPSSEELLETNALVSDVVRGLHSEAPPIRATAVEDYHPTSDSIAYLVNKSRLSGCKSMLNSD